MKTRVQDLKEALVQVRKCQSWLHKVGADTDAEYMNKVAADLADEIEGEVA